MSEIRVNTITSEDGGNAVAFTKGINITGTCTATTLDATLSGDGSGISGIVTSGAAAGSQTVAGTVIFSGDTQVGGALTVVGNLKVDGTQTIVNTSTLDVADKTVGIASTTAATNTTAAGAGIEVYASSSTAIIIRHYFGKIQVIVGNLVILLRPKEYQKVRLIMDRQE